MPSTAPEVIASIVAAVTALVAVVIGPFVTIRATKAQLLGPMRQAWINSLRDAVAEFTSKVQTGVPQTAALLSPNEELRHAAELVKIDHQQHVYQLKTRISLLINPKEANHQELVRLIDAAYTAYMANADASVQLKAITEHTQTVLKTEWNVIKS